MQAILAPTNYFNANQLRADQTTRKIMSIQEIAVSNNQKKQLLKAIKKDEVLFQEDNGDLVVSVAAYVIFKKEADPGPLEAIMGEDTLDFNAEYFVFS